MSRLAQIHEQRREADVQLNALKLHAALLTEAIDSGKIEQAEAQLAHLVEGIHGQRAFIAQRPRYHAVVSLNVRSIEIMEVPS